MNPNTIVPYIIHVLLIRFLSAHPYFPDIFLGRLLQVERCCVGKLFGLCLRRIPSPRLRDGMGGSHPRERYRFSPGQAYFQSPRQEISPLSRPTDAGHRSASYHHRSGGTRGSALLRLWSYHACIGMVPQQLRQALLSRQGQQHHPPSENRVS